MKVTWLTRAGLLFKSEKATVLVDPSFKDIPRASDICKDLSVDIILLTHEHKGHADTETLKEILQRAERPVTVLSSYSAYLKVSEIGLSHNYVVMNPHTVWSEKGITFYSVRAEHSDRTAVGFIIDDGEKTYYASGDTLYNYDVIDEVLELVEDGVDYAFLPISGKNNTMNPKDAADFAYEIDAKQAIPIHYGESDSVSASDFDYDLAMCIEPFVEYDL